MHRPTTSVVRVRARTGHRLRDVPHLARRFFGSLRPQPPDQDEEAWLLGLLSPAERELYHAQPLVDRVHSVACAVAARDRLARPSDDLVVASALHDVGKAQAGLGTFGRVMATVVEAVVPAGVKHRFASPAEGWRARLDRYARHDRIGADLLRAAGSADVVVAWAAEHHRAEDQWTIAPEIGRVLLAADG